MSIKCLFMDVDGTLTDGKLYIGECGEIMKAFSVKDGHGIKLLRSNYGVKPIVLTGRDSMIVKKRCEELGIVDFYQNVEDKVALIKSYEEDYSPGTFAYVGDDINDITAIQYVNAHGGVTACPADAALEVKKIVAYISTCKGGDGAVRDFVEYMITNCLMAE